jgi:hypothetical protein
LWDQASFLFEECDRGWRKKRPQKLKEKFTWSPNAKFTQQGASEFFVSIL